MNMCVCMYVCKELWSSAEIINIINYFFRNLNCILWLLCYAQYLIVETVVLTFVFVLYRLFHLCVMFSLSFSLYDKFHVQL
jgi:hypothetical protein